MKCFLTLAATCIFGVAYGFRLKQAASKLSMEAQAVNSMNQTQGLQGVRAAEECECGPDDDKWDKYCLCPVDENCEWAGSFEDCEPFPEDGLEEDTISYSPSDLGNDLGDRTVDDTRFTLLNRFPIVSQNTLDKDEGSHACWAVTRASNYRFADVLGYNNEDKKAGALAYSNWLYTRHPNTGWFIPTNLYSFKLKSQYARVWNDNPRLNKNTFGLWVKNQINQDRSIAVAMGKNSCDGTFHYVTIIGVTSDNKHVIVADPWCPEYDSDYPIYYTKGSNTAKLGRYDGDSDDDEYDVHDHPCIVKAAISGFGTRALTTSEKGQGHAIVGMPYLSGLNYAADDGGRCAYKMWIVCKGKEKGKCTDTR